MGGGGSVESKHVGHNSTIVNMTKTQIQSYIHSLLHTEV